MDIQTKCFEQLPEEAAMIRRKVFIEEQGFVNEFDETDSKALHIVLYADSSPAGVCRVFYSEEYKAYAVGRFAVLKEFRGEHLGARILKAAEAEILRRGEHSAVLSSQKQAMGFYEKQGYKPVGDFYSDEGCPHIRMIKELK